MKKINLLLLLAIFAFTANSQLLLPENSNNNKNVNHKKSDLKGTYTYALDSVWLYDFDSLDNPYVKYKYLFDFDENGIENSFRIVTLNSSTNNFENFYWGDYNYYNNGKTIVLSVFWNYNDSIYKHHKDSVIYDDNGNKTLFFVFDGDSVWVNDEKTEYVYDANGNLIIYKYSYWSNTASSWRYDEKKEYTYSSNGLLTEELRYDYDQTADTWKNYRKYIYNYDGSNLTEKIELSWNSSASQWDSSYKDVYTYNSNNLLTSHTSYYFDNGTNTFVEDDKEDYTYDADGRLIIQVEYYWNGTSWDNDRKYQYYYDGSGELYVERDEYDWDNTDGWVLDEKEMKTYADSIDINTVKISFLFVEEYGLMDNLFVGTLTDYVNYEYNPDGTYQYDEKDKFFYNKLNSNNFVSGYKFDASIKMFPNPTSDVLYVYSDKNIDGRIVVSGINGGVYRTVEMNGTKVSVPVQSLPSGVYVVSIVDNNGNTLKTSRIIKK